MTQSLSGSRNPRIAEKVKELGVSVIIDEAQRPTIIEACQPLEYPIPADRVPTHPRKSNFSTSISNKKEENARPKKLKEVAVGGVQYPSMIAAYRHLNPQGSYPIICRWIRDGMDPTEAFEKRPMKRGRPNPGFILKGIFYKSDVDAYRKLKPSASYQTIQIRIREGMSRSEAFSLPAYPKIGDGIVYAITHKQSGKTYVGQTFSTLEKCWKIHVYNAIPRVGKKGTRPGSLQEAIRREGVDAFERTVLERKKMKSDLKKRKNDYISEMKTKAPHGYNLLEDN